MTDRQDSPVGYACNSEEQPTDFLPPPVVSVSSSMQVTCPKAHSFSSQSTARFFLDIFSGASMPVSTAVQKFSGDRVEPIDLIHGLDLLDDDLFESLLRLASSGQIGAAVAAPYCCKYSWATLRPNGPAPVCTPEFLDGLPTNTIQQQLAVQESSAIHDRSRILLSAVDQQAGLVILENPSTSMTWDDTMMYEWVHVIAPFAAQACACQFGKDWAKSWMFVANRPSTSSTRTRRGGSCLKDIYIYKTFLIYRTCMRRAPAKPVRALCETGVLFHMSHLKLHVKLHT